MAPVCNNFTHGSHADTVLHVRDFHGMPAHDARNERATPPAS